MSMMYFKGEIEQELRETHRELKFRADSDIEEFMHSVEESRVTELYPHCQNEVCIRKG